MANVFRFDTAGAHADMPAARPYFRWLVQAAVLAAAGYGMSATAQVSVGATAAASAPGATSSANGGVGGVGLGGVGPGVTVNPGVNSGAGVNAQGRYVGNNALSGPRARSNAEIEMSAGGEVQNSGQRAMAIDSANRARAVAPARDAGAPTR